MLVARSPKGVITALNLQATPIYRLSLRVHELDEVALTLDYVAGGAVSWMVLASVPLSKDGRRTEEAAQIVGVGMPYPTIEQNRTRMIEAVKVLHNSEAKEAEVRAATQGMVDLVDLYHAIRARLWESGGPFTKSVGEWLVAVEEGPINFGKAEEPKPPKPADSGDGEGEEADKEDPDKRPNLTRTHIPPPGRKARGKSARRGISREERRKAAAEAKDRANQTTEPPPPPAFESTGDDADDEGEGEQALGE